MAPEESADLDLSTIPVDALQEALLSLTDEQKEIFTEKVNEHPMDESCS
jgi:hypothetical protein